MTQDRTTIASRLEDLGVRSLRAGGVDMDGLWRAKHLTTAHLGAATGLSQSNFVFGIDIHDALYEPVSDYTGWTTGWPDVRMLIDPGTIRAVPWEPGVATAICSYVEWDDTSMPLCPRGLLSRAVDQARALGYEPDVAVELEFFVLAGRPEPGTDGRITRPAPLYGGNHGYHPFRGMEVLERWSSALADYGIQVEGTLTEWGASQFEINLAHGSPVEVADQVLMTKHALKALAARDGYTVTFMARTQQEGPGSSGHVHLSLKDATGANVFYDSARPHHASETLLRFTSGLVRDLPSTALLALPFVNSYRRVGEYLSSPTRLNVGVENRTTGLRLITHSEEGARVEVRVPGADVNPYLILASTLMSGLAGLRDELEPAEILYGDGYADQTSPELPRTLDEAIERFDRSDRPVQLFGETFVKHYLHTRRWELAKWREAVTDWEIDRYLEMV